MIAGDERNLATDGCFRIRDWLASRGQSATNDLNNERVNRAISANQKQEEKESPMTNPKPNRTLSLGTLRPHTKTKDKSPNVPGTISIKRDLILDLHQQMTQSDDDEVVANLAGWFYDDAKGKYMRVQLSVKQRLEYRDDNPFWDFR
jgi:hypothetical protein